MDSFISWIGGKKLLRSRILKEFPAVGSFNRYIEVFGGSRLDFICVRQACGNGSLQ